MARISDLELERLKREVSLVQLIEAKGHKLERRGPDNFVTRCMFHEEKTASFSVSPKKGLFRCFGCKASGSVIDFVMKADGLTFRRAVEKLEGLLVATPASARSRPSPSAAKPAPVLEATAEDRQLLRQVVDYYHRTLKETPEALEYLKKRGLQSARMVEHFKLGFSDRTLGLKLPSAGGEDARVRERLKQLGVFRESTGHEHLVSSLVVPLFSEGGDVVGLYGRKVADDSQLKVGTPKHLYLPGQHRAAFNSKGLIGNRCAIVCEALLDALTFWVAGFTNVISSYGVDGFTPHHLEALKVHGVEDVLIAYDADPPGDAGAGTLAGQLRREGLKCWRVQFPRGLDANAYALSAGSPKALSTLLRQAAFMDAGGTKARPPLAVPAPLSAALATAADPPSSSTAPPGSALPIAPLAKPRWQWTAEEKEEERQAVIARGMAQLSILSAPAAAAPAPSSSAAPAAGSTAADPGTAAAPAATTATEPAVAESSAPTPTAPSEGHDAGADEHVFHFGQRRYRVRGLAKNATTDSLKVNLLLAAGDAFHVDTFDLYQAKARAQFVAQAAAETRLDAEDVRRDVGQLLLKVEALADEAAKAAQAPKVPAMTDAERDAALELLKAPDLLQRVLADFERCGVVGEHTNKLVGYLAAVSRKLEEPLAVLIQSSSAAGKSSLMEAVLAFVPEEELVKYSAMTGQSLFYMGDTDLKHKVLAVVEEEGASRASYALKLLQSEGELTIASTGKNPSTGRLETHEYHVEGPTQLFLTTTASELDEELLNRCLVLTVDEEREQTQAIHRLQREKQTLEGLLARRARETTLKLHRNAQRLLRPLLVANPFARSLTFLDDRTRARRDFPKYLTLIRALALLHQHQRPLKRVRQGELELEYIEATLDDVAVANRLATAVLGRSLDELPPQTRRLLSQLEAFVIKRAAEKQCGRGDVWFTRKELRAALRWGDTQLFLHLGRLLHLEHLHAQRGERGVLHYRLADEAATREAPALSGLANVETLKAYGGQDSEMPARIRGAFGVHSAPTPERSSSEKREAFSPLAAGFGAAENAHPPLNGAASKSTVPAPPNGAAS